ncbi:hypothetical protein [Streptomyces sp. NL15-2K]|uniref:hypothetical protein n=1 Tax=Streptomyces sp. NL15-2K TaxID=376149 RepID=UPI000FF9380F|nr:MULTISPECIES: hypothetical protein [Actinomycetes]WKX13280.1 hypothetical protein Q4V64_39455 [Kutzneria buriramensis]GCB45360.1 hypothetical protein SNL152K_2650 [Streptomyces sp. NL15-2K]
MSEETVPLPVGVGQPKGLLQQMEELMAALNADLSDLKIEAGFPPDESPGAAESDR